MRRYLTVSIGFGLAVLLVAIISWFVFPEWHAAPGGFWATSSAVALALLAILKDAVPLLKELAKKEPPKELPKEPPTIVRGDVSGENVAVAGRMEDVRVGGISIKHFEIEKIILHPDDSPPRRAAPPAPPPHFTGREIELDRLAGLLISGQSVAITALQGMGGIGKTALAQKLAEMLLASKTFPGGVLWCSLGQTADVFSALAAWASQADPRADLTKLPDNAARAAEVRSLLAKLGCLCAVLDDVWQEEAARTLLNAIPAGCAVLITTRDAELAKALRCRLERIDILPEDQCVQLMEKLLGPLGIHEASGREIARLCEGLPLAIELIAGLADAPADLPALAEGLRRRPALELLKLPGGETREKSVEASLKMSYDQLAKIDSHLPRRFRALGIFPAPFDEAALAAVWGDAQPPSPRGSPSTAPKTGDEARVFLRSNLLSRDPATGLYQQHALLRAYALALLLQHPAEAAAALERHAAHYLEQGKKADDLFKSGGAGVSEGLARFAVLWPHLQTDWQRLSGEEVGWLRPPSADRWLSDFPYRVAYVLDLHPPPKARIPILKSALEAARRSKDRSGEGTHLGNMGLAYFYLGDARRAIQFYEQRLAIAREIGDRRGEGNALSNMGNAHLSLGDARRAIQFYEQALAIDREIGDRCGEGNALGNLGNAYLSLGDARRALEYYEQALAIAREIGERRSEGTWLGNLGLAYFDLGDARRAIQFYEQRLAIAREIGDRRGEGDALGNMGSAYEKLGDKPRARKLWQQALAIYEAIEDPRAAWVKEWLEGDSG
jgi:tetratricopeptide (TPR) repeat protein